ncbi:MAG: hypothetical protein IJ794_17505 [Lachnospiraceae bacterium]|nr:hypothetical protein [Lachnospiraceae bacterium]
MKRLFYAVFVPCLAAILGVALLHPQNNLVPSRMFLYMLVWVGILAGIRAVFLLSERKLQTISRWGLIIYSILYGVALYTVSVLLCSAPVTDYGEVYQTALRLSAQETVTDWSYFSMWTNNLGTLTILTACMRMGRILGFQDPYYFVLGVNVLQMVAVQIAIFYLGGKIDREHKVAGQWFAMVVFTLWTPVWTSTNAFYSDQLSFGGSILAAALLLYAMEECKEKTGPKWICCVCAGMLWGIAACVKATAAIGLVAGGIVCILSFRNIVKKHWRVLLLFAVSFCIAFGGLYAYDQTYPSKADEYRLKTPVEFWIAMGLMGNGTYSDNAYLIRQCNFKPNVDERRAFCRKMIRENANCFYEAEHLYEKTSVIFGSGDILPTSLMYPDRESFLWQLVYWEGDYYWKYTCTCTGFFYAVLLLMLAGSLLQAIREEPADLVFWIYLTVFGLFLFLMFWEAQNKQLFNHIPWMTLAAVYGIRWPEDFVRNKLRKYVAERE